MFRILFFPTMKRHLRILITLAALISLPMTMHAQVSNCDLTPYDCALVYIERQDFESTIRYLNQELKQSPQNLKAINLLGIALTGMGKIDQANLQFKKALRINPRFYPALKNLAINEFTLNRRAEAREHFEAVLKYEPENEVTHLYLGDIDFEEKRFTSALEHYEKGRAAAQQNTAFLLRYSECLLREGRGKDALSILYLLPENDAVNGFRAGVILGQAGSYAEAARFFGLARNGYDDPYVAGYNQTLMLVRAGDYAGAIRAANELIVAGHNVAELHNLLSEAYLKAGKIQEAYDALRTATKIAPKEEDHYVDLAAICLDYANYDLGLEIVDIGINYLPNSDRLYLQRGVLMVMKGLPAQAVKDFEIAGKLAPEKALPTVALGIAWIQLGQAARAVKVLREKVSLYRKDFMIHYIFGTALLWSGAAYGSAAENEAVAAFEASIRLNPNFSPPRAELGKVLLRRGEVDRAVTELERAVALDPDGSSPNYQLAHAYLKKGQTARAEELMAKVSQLREQERNFNPGIELRRIIKESKAHEDQERTKSGVIKGESGMVEADSPEFKQANKVNPKSAEAHFQSGLSYEQTGRITEAISEYQEALRLKPELAEARYGLSSMCVKAGDLSGAIHLLRLVIKAEPNFSEARYNLAINLWNRYNTNLSLKSDLDEAIQELLAASRLEPRQPKIYAVLGRILVEKQDLDKAVEHLRKAVDLTPNNPEYRYDLGLALRLKGELDAAEAELREAINHNPKYALAHRALGLILRQKGDLQGAATELRISVAELPEDAQGHHLLGTVLLKLNDFNGAIEELRQAIDLDSYLTEARVNLAQALQKAGQKEEAQKEVMESRKIESEKSSIGRAMVLIEKASEHIKQGEYAKAVGLLREAATVSPRFPETHYQLGLALRQSSADEAESETAFRRVIDLDPNRAVAHYQLGMLLRKRGDLVNASSELRTATNLAPSLVECYRELGQIALAARDWATAEAEYKKFLAWEPGNAEVHYDLATALKAQGHLDEAAQELRIAQRLNPRANRQESDRKM